MTGYRLVKYCRHCKKRFLLQKGEKQTHYCEDCQKIIRRHKDERKS